MCERTKLTSRMSGGVFKVRGNGWGGWGWGGHCVIRKLVLNIHEWPPQSGGQQVESGRSHLKERSGAEGGAAAQEGGVT